MPDSTELDNSQQPYSVTPAGILDGVPEPIDLKPVLWSNLYALMTARWGKENMSRLRGVTPGSDDELFSPGTGTRIKKQDTSIGIDIVAKCAYSLGVEPWQLLVPDINPSSMPRLERRVMSPQAQDLAAALDRLTDPVKRQKAYAVALVVINLVQEGRDPPPPMPPTA